MNHLVIFILLTTNFVYLATTTTTANDVYLQNNETFVTEFDFKFFNYTNSFDMNRSNNTTSADIDFMLEQHLGPRRKSLVFTVVMSITYILIFLCGLIGNICVCCVIICNNCMHTTTNYYLFSLAVSDVLSVLFGLPTEIFSLIVGAYPWKFGNTFCVIRTFVFEATTIATALTILAFTFERWLHICKPMYAQKFSNSFGRALKIICFIWILSSILALPYSITTGSENYFQDIPDSKLCKPLDQYERLMTTMLLLSSVFLFIVPMTLISIMYILIGLTLWDSHTRKKNYPSEDFSRSDCFKSYRNGTKPKPTIVQSTSSSPQFLSNEQKTLLNSQKNYNKYGVKNNEQIKTKNSATDSLHVKSSTELNFSDFSLYDTTSNAHSNSTQNERRSKELDYISYRAKQSRRDVIKMLFVVVICFFLCWAPHHLQRIMTYIVQRSGSAENKSVTDSNQKIMMMNVLEFLYYTSGVLVYISSTINPILYNVMSKRYRTAFKNTLTMICTCSCSSKSLSSKRSTFYYNKYSSRNNTFSSYNKHNNSVNSRNQNLKNTNISFKN